MRIFAVAAAVAAACAVAEAGHADVTRHARHLAAARAASPSRLEDLQWAPTDAVQVFHVEAALSKAKYGQVLGDLNLYHTGVLFHNTNSGENATFEFTAVHFGAFFPLIVDGKMSWDDAGVVLADPNYDDQYWDHKRYVADITGAAYADYLSWVHTWNSTHCCYLLFEVRGATPAGSLSSNTCMDFMFQSLTYLYNRPTGTQFVVEVVSRDDILVYADDVLPADVSDPAVLKDVVNFYSTVEQVKGIKSANITDLLENVIPSVLGQLGGAAYIKTDRATYYQFMPVKPFFHVSYEPHVLPRMR